MKLSEFLIKVSRVRINMNKKNRPLLKGRFFITESWSF